MDRVVYSSYHSSYNITLSFLSHFKASSWTWSLPSIHVLACLRCSCLFLLLFAVQRNAARALELELTELFVSLDTHKLAKGKGVHVKDESQRLTNNGLRWWAMDAVDSCWLSLDRRAALHTVPAKNPIITREESSHLHPPTHSLTHSLWRWLVEHFPYLCVKQT